MAETFVCSHCGQELPLSERDEFNGRVLCQSCQDMLTVVCDHCDTLLWRSDDHGDDRITLCEHCRDHYSACCECGHLVPNDELHYSNDDDDEGYCDNCYHSHGPSQVVQSYYYKPKPIFFGEGIRFLGVELEMDEGGESDKKAARIMDRPIQPSRTCKVDDYLEEVVQYGLSRGVPEAELRLLIEAGYDALDLEELLYDPTLRQSCVQEIVCDLGVCCCANRVYPIGTIKKHPNRVAFLVLACAIRNSDPNGNFQLWEKVIEGKLDISASAPSIRIQHDRRC